MPEARFDKFNGVIDAAWRSCGSAGALVEAFARSMEPSYNHPGHGMYQPQRLWSPDPYPLAPNYYSYPLRVTHSAGVEVAQAVHRQINQSDNEEGEQSEVS